MKYTGLVKVDISATAPSIRITKSCLDSNSTVRPISSALGTLELGFSPHKGINGFTIKSSTSAMLEVSEFIQIVKDTLELTPFHVIPINQANKLANTQCIIIIGSVILYYRYIKLFQLCYRKDKKHRISAYLMNKVIHTHSHL